MYSFIIDFHLLTEIINHLIFHRLIQFYQKNNIIVRIFLQTHYYSSLYGLYLFNWLLIRVFIDYLRIPLNNFIFMVCDNHILPTNTHKIRVNFIIVHIKLLQTSPVSYVPELDQWILATANDYRVHKLIPPLAYHHIIDVVLFRNNTL